MLCAESSIAAPAKQSIATAGGLTVPPPAVSATTSASRATAAKAVSRTQLRRKAKAAYPRTHLERAKYFKQKGNLNSALVEYLRATQENPRLTSAYYEQAVIFRQRGFRKLAESALERALAVNKDYQQARILLATVRLEQGNFGGAVEELSRSLGLTAPTISTISRPPKSEDDIAAKATAAVESASASVLQSLHECLPLPESSESEVPAKKTESSKENHSSDAANSNDDDDSHVLQSEQNKQDDPFFSIQVRLPNPLKMFHWLSEDAKDKRKPKRKTREESSVSSKKSSEEEKETEHKEIKKRKARSWLTRFMQVPEQPEETSTSPEQVSEKRTEKTAQKNEGEVPQEKIAVKEAMQTEEPSQKTAPAAEEKSEQALSQAQEKARDGWSQDDQSKVTVATTIAMADAQSGFADTIVAAPQLAEKPWNLPLPNFTATGFFAAFNRLCSNVAMPTAPEKKAPAEPEDEWMKRLRYLNDNGTATLKDGEAFMFSEETGEAVLILASGKRIQRIIAQPQDAQEVLKLRRPDVLIPQELMYNLSLLGRLMPKEATEQRAPTVPQPPMQIQTPDIEKPFSRGEMLGKREGIFDWFRGIMKL